MLILCKSMVLGAAFLTGVAIAAHADPASTNAAGTVTNGVRGSQSQGRDLAALPPSTAMPAPNRITLPEVTVFAPYSSRGVGPRVSSFGTIRTEHYEVSPDFDENIAMHPYTSGIGPWPGPGTSGSPDKPRSHHFRQRSLGSIQ
jgi:hypothetical protein